MHVLYVLMASWQGFFRTVLVVMANEIVIGNSILYNAGLIIKVIYVYYQITLLFNGFINSFVTKAFKAVFTLGP